MAEEVCVEFDGAIQSLDALNAAAYRLIDIASCQIEKADGRFLCKLTPRNISPPQKSHDLQANRSPREHDGDCSRDRGTTRRAPCAARTPARAHHRGSGSRRRI